MSGRTFIVAALAVAISIASSPIYGQKGGNSENLLGLNYEDAQKLIPRNGRMINFGEGLFHGGSYEFIYYESGNGKASRAKALMFRGYQLKAAYSIHFHDKKRYSMNGISERKCHVSFQTVKSKLEKAKGVPDLQRHSWGGEKYRDTHVWRSGDNVVVATSFCGDACDNQYSRLCFIPISVEGVAKDVDFDELVGRMWSFIALNVVEPEPD